MTGQIEACNEFKPPMRDSLLGASLPQNPRKCNIDELKENILERIGKQFSGISRFNKHS